MRRCALLSFNLPQGLCCAALLACAQSTVSPPSGTPAVRLLFVGNSLTSAFDIPGQVRQMATAAGFTPPVVLTRAYPDFALEDHWNQGVVQQDLANGHFDFMIMQQGASTLPESGVNLTRWTGTWTTEANRAGTRAGLYVVWAPLGGNLDAGIANYEAAANAAGTAIYPVAEAWREASSRDAGMPLYSADGLHPSEHGAWLAALVITSVIFDRAPRPFPNLYPALISGEQEATLRAAAAVAVARFARR